ncbi:MAG TPA: response regulator transcription factor [Azospirillum sp.]|nr:response regulator transcription factor [Azospirillum sp.]
MLTVLIADDHPLFRNALRDILRATGESFEILEASTVEEARRKAHDDLDLILLDLSMPEAVGFSALVGLRNAVPSVPILIVSAFADPDTVRQAATYGAAGFIAKTAEPLAMAAAVSKVLAGGRYWPTSPVQPETAQKSGEAPPDAMRKLSRTESKVLELMAEGKANKLIAYELGIKESTVKTHVTSLLRKLNVYNRTQAVMLANQARFGKP